MGRSWTDRAPARRLVEDLEVSGAQVTVVRGEVINFKDVERAVACIHGSVGGVIQAAMGLNVSVNIRDQNIRLIKAVPRKRSSRACPGRIGIQSLCPRFRVVGTCIMPLKAKTTSSTSF